MALIHIDGFDHYGDDETKMTEGIYEQVDAAFSLSSSNPRTGNLAILRDTSTNNNKIVRSLGGQRQAIGTGFVFYIDQLPSIDDTYAILEFLDQNQDYQVTVVLQSDGTITIKRGDKSGFVIAESDTNAITPGQYNHFEIALNFDSGETDTNILIDVDSSWEFQSETGWPTAPNPETVTIPSSGYSTGNAPFGELGPDTSLIPPYDINTNWPVDTFLWLRNTISTDGSSDILISSEIENAALFYFDGNFIVGHNPNNDAINRNIEPLGNVNYTITKDIATKGTHTISILAMDGPTTSTTDATYIHTTIEYINRSDVKGLVEVRVNGVTVISDSDADTTRTGNKECSYITAVFGGGPASHGVTTSMDDWYIWDDQGSWNNHFLGDRRCYLLRPNQDTNIADFDPSSGSFGYKMIDDFSPDDDSTYIIAEAYLQSGSPLTGTSEFEIEDLPDGTSLISGINVLTRAAKTDSTSAEIFTSINSGANSLYQSAHTLTTTYGYFSDIYEYDPSTIASLTKNGFDEISVSITADDLDPGAVFDSPVDFESPTDETDPFFLNVESLLHFEGSDGSTTFTDVTGRSWAANGNAQLDTAQFKFGTASGLFDGSGDYITTPTDSNIHLSTNDFTVEFWLRPNSVSVGQGLYDQRLDAGQAAGFVITQPGSSPSKIFFGAGDSNHLDAYEASLTSTTSVSVGSWVHIAVTRQGSNFRLFVGGNLEGTSVSSVTIENASIISIGALANGSASLNGWIDDLRVTIGAARYTANFTPPTEQFPDS